eukprot:1117837-Prorocentrum_minimum.AAC.1
MASIDKRVCGWGTGAPAAVAGGTAPRAPRAGVGKSSSGHKPKKAGKRRTLSRRVPLRSLEGD